MELIALLHDTDSIIYSHLPSSLWIVTVTVLEAGRMSHPGVGEQLVKLIINVSLFSKRVSSVILKVILGDGSIWKGLAVIDPLTGAKSLPPIDNVKSYTYTIS